MENQPDFHDQMIKTLRPVPSNYFIDTSGASADKLNKSKRHQYRLHIFEYIRERGGATCDEVEQALELRHQTASCFIRFLTQDDLLKDSGEKRITRAGRRAIVWVMNEQKRLS